MSWIHDSDDDVYETDFSQQLKKERAKNRQLTNELAKRADEYNKLAEHMENEIKLKKEIKRKASEDSMAKDALLSLLRPPKFAKNDYLEQKPAKYIFRCMDGDIQIPEYGILRTDFYYKE